MYNLRKSTTYNQTYIVQLIKKKHMLNRLHEIQDVQVKTIKKIRRFLNQTNVHKLILNNN